MVDLPLPVGPVTSTRPRFLLVISTTSLGIPRSSGSGILKGRLRITAASVPLCLKTFTRKRPTPEMA